MPLKNERGSVTAEFAVTLPAILMVLAIVIGSLSIATHKIVLTSAVFDIARLEARGDLQLLTSRTNELPTGVLITKNVHNNILCVSATQNPGRGILSVIKIEARGCAVISAGGFNRGVVNDEGFNQ